MGKSKPAQRFVLILHFFLKYFRGSTRSAFQKSEKCGTPLRVLVLHLGTHIPRFRAPSCNFSLVPPPPVNKLKELRPISWSPHSVTADEHYVDWSKRALTFFFGVHWHLKELSTCLLEGRAYSGIAHLWPPPPPRPPATPAQHPHPTRDGSPTWTNFYRGGESNCPDLSVLIRGQVLFFSIRAFPSYFFMIRDQFWILSILGET